MKKIFFFLILASILSCKKDKNNSSSAGVPSNPPPTNGNHILEYRVYNKADTAYVAYSGCCIPSASFSETKVLTANYFSYKKTISDKDSMVYQIQAVPYIHDTIVVQILLDGKIKKTDTSFWGTQASINFFYPE